MFYIPSEAQIGNPIVTMTGISQDDLFGWNVSDAGDVNGDGYDDIIVGAPGYDKDRGRVYIFFGGPWYSGDLKAETANITINGSNQGDRFGWDVACAGDVNKDGYDEVIVGAPGNTSGTGAAYIYFGHKFSLAAVKAQKANVTFIGEKLGDSFGSSVSGAGDVNGDGFDDVIVGAPGYDSKTGKAFIFLGNSSTEMQLKAINANTVFWGEKPGDGFGFSVSRAGNVNYDTYDDVIIGAPGADRIYIFFGGKPMNAWYQSKQADFDSAATKVHTNTTSFEDGEVQLETFHNIKAMTVYFDGSNPPDTPEIPRNRTWDQQFWSNEKEGYSVGTDSNQWFVVKSGTVRKNEKILAISDSGLDLNVQISDGVSWGSVLEMPNVIRDDKYRGFDVAYESLSGDALLTYFNDTSPTKLIPKYRIWNGTEWSSEMDAQAVGTADIHWVVLASNPLSDEILMVTLDRGNRDIYAQVWNGTNWGNVTIIESQASRDDCLCFDVAYEQQSGFGMILWGGDSGGNKNLNYRRWRGDNGNWSEPQVNLAAAKNQVNWVRLAADPKTNYVLMGILDNGKEIDAQVWNGSAWGTRINITENAERNIERCFDIAWETKGDKEGLIVYGITDHRPAYRNVTGTSIDTENFVLDALPPDNGRNPNWIVLRSDLQTDDIMLMYLVDDGGGNGGAEDDIGVELWNGSDWEYPQRIEFNSTRDNGQSYDFSHTDTSGYFISASFDAKTIARWGRIFWTAKVPLETTMKIRTRTSPDATTWSLWSEWYNNYDRIKSPENRWIQYQVWFETANITLTPVLYDITIELNHANLTINGTSGESFGWSVSNAGDIDNDSYDDVIIGAPQNKSAQGAAYIFYGTYLTSKDEGDRFIKLASGDSANITLIGDSSGDLFGYSVSFAGNVNGDGYDDIIIGAPTAQINGSAYVFLGSSSWPYKISATNASYIFTEGNAIDNFGWSVSYAGDVINITANCDEMLIGAPYFDAMADVNAGKVYTYHLYRQPDLIINGEIDDVYQDVPNGLQNVLQYISEGENTTWWITVENDGNLNDTYDFKIDTFLLIGWSWELTENITGLNVGNGDRINLAPGESENYTLSISSNITATIGDESWVIINIYSQNDTLKRDSVKGIAHVIDITPPEITDTTVSFPTTGDVFTITASIMDNMALGEVHLYYWFDLHGGGLDGPYNVSMDPGFVKDINVPTDAIKLYYNISANDTSNNWNQTGIVEIDVIDNDKPATTDLTVGSPTTGDLFIIIASVTDNIIVNEVHLYYWFELESGGTEGPYNMTMDPGFSKDINTPTDALVLHYNISANDTSNNWNETGETVIDVLDNDTPSVLDTTIGSPTSGDILQITASVSDNINVSEVYIFYWLDLYGGGIDGPYNITMNPGYTMDINVPHNATTLHYNISANDTSNNWNETGEAVISVLDNDLPILMDITSGSPSTGDTFSVAVSAYDNIQIENVHILFWFETTGGPIAPVNVSMTDVGGGIYECDINIPSNALVLRYKISANDTSDNWNEKGFVILGVVDNDIPDIIDTTSGSPTTGETFTITASITDNIAIDGVYLFLWFDLHGGGVDGPYKVQMNPGYVRNIDTPSNAVLMHYNLSANDTGNNWNETGITTLNVGDNDLPNLTDVTMGLPTTGDIFTISGFVTDNIALGEVYLYYLFELFGGGIDGPYNVTMNPGYTRDIRLPNNALKLHYNISANDTSSNWNETGERIIPVEDNDLPQITDFTFGIPTTGENFAVMVQVTDNVCIDKVYLFLWFDTTNGPIAEQNFSMNDLGGGNYERLINIPQNALVFHYNISANDTSNNWRETGLVFLYAQDNDPPQINNESAEPSSQEAWLAVNIKANIMDQIGVNEVLINITFPDGSWENKSMIKGIGNEWHCTEVYIALGTYNFQIWVNDTSNNQNLSVYKQFTITQPDSPGVDYIQIRNQPNNDGEVVKDMIYLKDVSDYFYAAGYNHTYGYLGEVEVNWVSNNEDSGPVNPTFGTNSIFTAIAPGTGSIFAIYGLIQNSTTFEVIALQSPEIVGTIPDIQLYEDYILFQIDLNQFASDPQDPKSELKWYLKGVDTSIFTTTGENQTGNHIISLMSKDNMYGNMEVTYYLLDSDGNIAYQMAWINVSPVNDPPSISDCPDLFVRFDLPYTFNYSPYVIDVDNEISELELTSNDTANSEVNELSVTYNYPASMINKSVYVILRITDGQTSDSELIKITITSDYPPIGVAKIPDVTLFENETKYVVFDLDDYITDPDGDSLYMSYGYTHLNITIHNNHTVDISAIGEWNGVENVTFRAQDPIGAIVEQTIKVTVLPVNDPPIIKQLPNLVVRYDHPYLFDLFWYISDSDNDLEDLIISTTNPDNVTVVGTCLILNYPEYWEGKRYPYNVSLTVSVSDGLDSAFSQTTVYVSDDYPPHMLDALDDVFFYEDEAVLGIYDLDDYFMDDDGDTIFYTSGNINIEVTIHEDNTVDFSAPPNWFGSEYITIRAMDPEGAFVEDTILVTILPVNDPPNISDVPPQIGQSGELWVLDLRPYISDVDNTQEDLIINVDSPYVTVVDYMLIFTYPENITEDTIQITVNDGELTTTIPVEITIESPPPTPKEEPWYLYLILIILTAILMAILIARRGFYTVEDIFLITHSGLLIAHLGSTKGGGKDEDVVASMFVAVQDFVKDAFAEEVDGTGEGHENLNRMDYGNKKVLIYMGDEVRLSAFLSGKATTPFYKKMKNFVEDVEERYADALNKKLFSIDDYPEIEEMMLPLLEGRYSRGYWKKEIIDD